MGVVAQERAPGLARWTPGSAPAVAPNRPVADQDAELEQLASDALGAPQAILAGHGPDQLLNLGADVGTPASGAGLPAPEQTPALSMPAHRSIGRDDLQMLAPAGAEAAHQDPEQFVPGTKPGTRPRSSRSGQDGQLMAQQQVLEYEVLAWANAGQDGREQEPEQFNTPSASPISCASGLAAPQAQGGSQMTLQFRSNVYRFE